MKRVTAAAAALLISASLYGCGTATLPQSSAKASGSMTPSAAAETTQALPAASASDAVVVGMTSPGASAAQTNPMHPSSSKEIADTLGYSFHIPQEARNVRYFIIDSNTGTKTAQAVFVLNGTEYTSRIKSVAAYTDISGVYYDWTSVAQVQLGTCNGEVRFVSGKQGICLWYDATKSRMYSVYTETGATQAALLAVASLLNTADKK